VTLHIGAGTFRPGAHRGPRAPCTHRRLGGRGGLRSSRVPAHPAGVGGGWHHGGAGTRVSPLSQTGRARGVVRRDAPVHHAGFQIQVSDVLLTNFHLPESTLLMLVCAFAGQVRCSQRTRGAGAVPLFSYGDAMLLTGGALGRSLPSGARRGGARGPADHARQPQNAGLHAGRHLRHRQRQPPRNSRTSGRRSPRHLSPAAAPGPRYRPRRAARFHALRP
jgi:hypothetical protein